MVYDKKPFKKRSAPGFPNSRIPEIQIPRSPHHSSPRGPLAPLMTEEAKQAADIQTLSYDFACRITRLFQYLTEDSEYKEFIFSKQVVRSGTSIGANISEAMHPQSDADFLSKANISLKEARETNYWLNLLHDNGYLDDRQYSSLDNDLQRILKILVTIVGKVAKRLNSEKASKKPSSRIPELPNS